MSRVFANGPGDQGSIKDSKKWYLMLPCLTLSIMLRIKGKMEQSRERNSPLPYTSVW